MFVYSLPIAFDRIRLIGISEALFIAVCLFGLLWITAPPPSGRLPNASFDHYLFDGWSGRQNLAAVFWPFFAGLNAVLFGVDWLARTGQWTVSSWDDLHFVLVFPIVWWTASIWRCTANTRIRIYGAGARWATLAVAFEYALKLYLRIDYPRVLFECEELLLDYSSCF